MTKLYFIRHGESTANALNVFAGTSDFPLSETGHAQAKLTAKYLADKGIDVIYSSDLKRAYQTAEPTAKMYGIDVIKSEKLREFCGGKWEMLTYKEVGERFPEELNVFTNDIGSATFSGGESVADSQIRVKNAVDEICRCNDGKTVAIFIHAGVLRALLCDMMGLPLSEMKNIKFVGNASVTTAYCENGKYTVTERGYHEHLGSLGTFLP